MTVEHGDFTTLKTIAATPANVFRTFAEQELKRRWFVASDGPSWTTQADALDFRVGGRETGAGDLSDGRAAGQHENATTTIDIVEGERIVCACTMAMDGPVHWGSLATITFVETEAGCRLTVTDQGAHVPPPDGPELRKAGVTVQLDALARLFD